ncbi:type I-F CRISPR-associated endoribonuclease Cas6/Csy4, partial [Vibrio sp. 10N.222.55.F8]
MNYYQEITLLPDAEISLGFIWQNVFQQVHIALVDNKVAANQSAIAVGFPEY